MGKYEVHMWDEIRQANKIKYLLFFTWYYLYVERIIKEFI